MKKGLALVLSVVLLLLALGFALWDLRFSPQGVMNPQRPSTVMSAMMESTSKEQWESRLFSAWDVPVSQFESREEIFAQLFNEASATGELGFRRNSKDSFVLCTPERDLAILSFSYEDGQWTLAKTQVLLAGETHSIRIVCPENAIPKINHVALGEEYRKETALPYADMSKQELSFASYPTRCAYVVEGLYCAPLVEVEGAVLSTLQNGEWIYEPLDARSHDVTVLAPANAEVRVNSYLLGEEDLLGIEPLSVDVDLSAQKLASLPVTARYALKGLYTSDFSLEAVTPDGTVLTVREENGVYSFAPDRNTPPDPALETMAKNFIRELCAYGAGMSDTGIFNQFMPTSTELYNLLLRAQGSLKWIRGTKLELYEASAGDYIAVDENTCICTARVSGKVTNYYMSYEAEFAVQILCEKMDGAWKIMDMAYE